jgi:Terminase large subunit, T4likevirus-type, N-terminal
LTVHTVDTGYRPHRYQAEIHRTIKRFSVLACHRRFGKTYAAINELVDRAVGVKLPDARFGYVAPYRNQAKAIAWDYLKKFTAHLPGTQINEGDLFVQLGNGARIRIYGADNADAMRGLYFDGIVLDEVAQMKPEVWGEIIRPALADRRGWALFIGTPKGMNLFHDLWQRGQAGDSEWWSAVYRADETNIIPAEELEAAKREMSDAQYRQEFLCDWSASTDDSLITIDVASAAASRSRAEHELQHFPRIIGVDPARFGADRSVIQRRWGAVALPPIVNQGLDSVALAGRVANVVKEWGCDALFVDSGAGAGVIDTLRGWQHQVTEVNFGGKALNPRYKNKRAEMWDLMAQWLRDGGCIPNDADLKTDLTGPKYFFDPANRMCLESKDDMKERGLRSPDLGDALALTFAFPVAVRNNPNTSTGRVIHDYDPLDA